MKRFREIKSWKKWVIFGVIVFLCNFIALNLLNLLSLPLLYGLSGIDIYEFSGFDTTNDSYIDTIEVQISNTATREYEITNISFLEMSKNWNATLPFPISIPPVTASKLITLSAVTNQDQITADDTLHVEFFLSSRGTANPAIVITEEDIIRVTNDNFTLREEVFYSGGKSKNNFITTVINSAMISAVIYFCSLTVYIISEILKRRDK